MNMKQFPSLCLHPGTLVYVTFNPEIAVELGSNNAALLLSFLSDLDVSIKRGGREFFHEAADIRKKLNLGDYEFRAAKKVLMDRGILSAKRRGVDPKLWYTIHRDALHSLMIETSARLQSEQDADHLRYREEHPEEQVEPLESSAPNGEINNGHCGKPTMGSVGNQQWIIKSNLTTSTQEERGQSLQPRRFSAPSEEDARAYAQALGMPSSEGSAFIDFHTSKGWVIGKSPMKDWKAAMRTWHRRYCDRRKTQPPSSARPPSQTRTLTKEEQEARLAYMRGEA